LHRLMTSAEYFEFKIDRNALQKQIVSRPKAKKTDAVYKNADTLRVRVTLTPSGKLSFDETEFDPANSGGAVKLGLAKQPIDVNNPFLYHKTTNREVYNRARQTAENEVDDILLWNAQGNITESTIANIVFEKDGKLFTPPITDGLLPGTYRRMMLESKLIKEKSLPLNELKDCESLILINSLRGVRPVLCIV